MKFPFETGDRRKDGQGASLERGRPEVWQASRCTKTTGRSKVFQPHGSTITVTSNHEGANNLAPPCMGIIELDPNFNVSHTKDAVLYSGTRKNEDYLFDSYKDYQELKCAVLTATRSGVKSLRRWS